MNHDDLTDRQREALELLYGARLRYAEIAQRMGISVRKVKRLIGDGMQQLGRAIEAQGRDVEAQGREDT